MTWWQKLQKNPLARLGALVLLLFYLAVIAAEFVAPYDPYQSQPNASLLPPTPVYWRDQTTGAWLGPHVYPTSQGPVSLETGDRKVSVNFDQPSPIRLWAKGTEYHWLTLRLPLPTQFSFTQPSFEETELFAGFRGDRTSLAPLVQDN